MTIWVRMYQLLPFFHQADASWFLLLVCLFLAFVCLFENDEHQKKTPAVMTQQVVEVELMRQDRQRGGSQEPIAVEPVQCF